MNVSKTEERFRAKGGSVMEQLFKEYYARLAKEGFIKSLLCGLIVGFSVLFVAAAAFWYIGIKQFWILILAWLVATAAAIPVFYYGKFRPSKKEIARRIDDLGLEERILTMHHLENDTSYIAQKQREDAYAALNSVSANLIKFAISVPLIVIAAVSGVFGVGMTTVSALVKPGSEIVGELTAEPVKEYEVIYEAEDGGLIEGDMFQLVEAGKNATGVMAVAEEEWVFVEWSDGYTQPYREDLNIEKNLTFTAKFKQIEDGEPGEGEGDGEGEEAGDQPGQEEGNPQPGKDGKPGDGQQGGGRNNSNTQIKDGKTYYGDEYENALGDALDEVSQDGDLSEDQRGVIGDYFDAIQN